MTSRDIRNFDAAATASLLDYRLLVRTLAETIVEYSAGKVVSPERLAIPIQEGGLMLSMRVSRRSISCFFFWWWRNWWGNRWRGQWR